MDRSVDRQLELSPLSGSELPSPVKIANKTSDTSSKHGFASTVAARCRSVRNITTIEPLLAFYIVPVVIVNFAVQNLNLDKACRVNLNYSHEVCDALARRDMANYTLEEQEIQKLVAGMITWKSILQSGLPGFMILFWGSWSDRHRRRKPCMLFPVCGELIASILLILCVYFDRVPMEVVGVAETLFGGLSGGWVNMMLGVFSYIADVTSEKDRMFRIGIVNLCVTLGIPLGLASSGILLQSIGFYGVFALAFAMHSCSLIYGTFYVKESALNAVQVQQDGQPAVKRSMLADFFGQANVLDTFRVVFKNGPKQRRLRVVTLIIAIVVIVGPMFGEMTVFYLFTRYRFKWSEVDFSIFSTYNTCTSFLGISFSMAVFSKKLKFEDSIVAVISTTSKTLSGLVFGFAQYPWHLYLGTIVEMFSGTALIALRSIASKLVQPDELGKLNSLIGVAESITPLVYAPLYAKFYASTMTTMPGAFFLLGGAMTCPAIVIFLWMYYIQKRVEKHDNNSDDRKNGAALQPDEGRSEIVEPEMHTLLTEPIVEHSISKA